VESIHCASLFLTWLTNSADTTVQYTVKFPYGQVNVHGILKVKVKLSVCFFLTGHHAMKAYWGSGGIVIRILDFGIRRG
jgi:hypothetical protein